MIPGYRSVQGYVPEDTYRRALAAKGAQPWDQYLTKVLDVCPRTEPDQKMVAPSIPASSGGVGKEVSP